MAIQIQIRRGTSSEWSTSNPILAQGEVGYELNTGKAKVGDGLTAWNSLGYFNPNNSVTSVAMTTPTGLQVSGSPITTSGTLALTYASGYSIPTTSSQTNWDTAYTDRYKWDGGSSGLNASTGRTSLGLGTAATLNAGSANGVATLDGSGTVPTSQLPAAVLGGVKYQGTWNASTNTPTLASGTGTQGYYYVVSVAGSTNLDGITDWKIGDWVIYNGTAWQKVDNTDSVTSVNGYTGTVVLAASDVGAYPNTNPNGYTSNTGTVTSVAMTTPTGLSVSGSPITTTGTLALSMTAGYSIPTTASQTNWDSAYSERRQWDGGSTNLVASTGRTSLGATTLGSNLFTITDPGAITFPRFNADNTVSSLDAATFRTAIGAGTGDGTVTSVGATSPVASSGGTTPTISLSSGYGDTQNPYASKTANFFLAAPDGSAGAPTFRAIVAADVPTLNQNTTGTASNVTGVVALANGGSGQTTAQSAMNTFAGAVTSGSYLRGNGTNVVMSTIQAADVPTLNQNTTGTASNVTGTVAIANGGTGETTRQAAMDALAGAVTAGQYLRGNGTDVVMSAIQVSDVPTLNQNTTGTASNVTGTVAVANGGTGQTSYTDGQLLIGNSTGNTLTKATLTQGSGITITNGSGSISIDNAAPMTYPGAGIPNSTGTAWGTSYSTTGSGTVVALATSPSFTTPSLGVATATTINKVTFTAPATGSTLTIADGKTLTVDNSITFSGTDATTMTLPTTNATLAGLAVAQTFTATQTFSQINFTVNTVTVSANAGTVPITHRLHTFTNSSAAAMTITLATASAVDGQMAIVRIFDFSAAAQTINWVNTENSTVTVPTTSNGSTTLPLTVGFMYNNATSKWRCVASA